MKTTELIDLDDESVVDDDELVNLSDELMSREPFSFFGDKINELENENNKLREDLNDINNLVAFNHKLDTITSLLKDSLKPKKGRPPKTD